MMYEHEFESYMNIDINDAMETLGIKEKRLKNPSMFKFALADLLCSYDDLACSISNDCEILDSLLHLYAKLHVFKHELISIGARQILIDLVAHEAAMIFAQCVQFDSKYPVNFMNMLVYKIV